MLEVVRVSWMSVLTNLSSSPSRWFQIGSQRERGVWKLQRRNGWPRITGQPRADCPYWAPRLTPSLRQEHLKKVTGGGETQMGPTLHSALNPEQPASRHLGRSIVIRASAVHVHGPSSVGGLRGAEGKEHPGLIYETLFHAIPQERRTPSPSDSPPIS